MGKYAYVTGDPAFGMRINKDEKLVASVLKNNKINLKDKPTIGVCFHMNIEGERKVCGLNRQLARTLDDILKYCCQFLFIPNCTYTKGHKWQDDRLTHHNVVTL